MTPLEKALKRRRWIDADALLETDRDDLSSTTLDRALQRAARGPARLTERLLELGADPDAEGAGLPALHIAAGAANLDVLDRLLDAGADPNRKYPDTGCTPLHFAARDHDRSPVTLRLLDAGADPEIPDDRGKLPADYAENRENFAQFAILEEAVGASPDSVRAIRLWSAAHDGDLERLRTLLAKHEFPQSALVRAFFLAASYNDNILDELLDAGLDPDANLDENYEFSPTGDHPLVVAAANYKRSYPVGVGALLDSGADVARSDPRGDTVLHVLAGAKFRWRSRAGIPATDAGHCEYARLARIAVEHGADPARANDYGDTPSGIVRNRHTHPEFFHRALEGKPFPDPARELLERLRNDDCTPDAADELLDAGAVPDWTHWYRRKPLLYIVVTEFPRRLDIARKLVEAGADPAKRTAHGDCAVARATANDHRDIVEMIIDDAKERHIKTDILTQGLLAAVRHDHFHYVRPYLDAGAASRGVGPGGTPLHHIARNCDGEMQPYLETARLLMQHHAHPDDLAHQLRTPRAIARRRNLDELLELFADAASIRPS